MLRLSWRRARTVDSTGAIRTRLDLQAASSPTSGAEGEHHGTNDLQPMPGMRSLPGSGRRSCTVRIGEAGNMVQLSHAEWNQLVSLIQTGKRGTLG